ncbi:unnamed protein product, partial [Phaeothamnion confervicola]
TGGRGASSASGATSGAFWASGDRPAFEPKGHGPEEPFELGAGGQIPRPINRHLWDFQREGVSFLWRRYADPTGPKGAILSDDMGLGKTVQVIAFLSAVFKKTGTAADVDRIEELASAGELPEYAVDAGAGGKGAPGRPVLVVCPASVLASWLKHLEEWGRFAVAPLRGKKDLEATLDRARRGKVEIVLMSYPMLQASSV